MFLFMKIRQLIIRSIRIQPPATCESALTASNFAKLSEGNMESLIQIVPCNLIKAPEETLAA